jgi:2-polyprenyl-6-methoxyphenol hydroxylase-like FAD-dependent oxidoreductase
MSETTVDTTDLFSKFDPYLCPRHCDLQAWLIELVKNQNVELRYNAEVVRVDPQRPSVHLASGETWLGDLVIGADGYASQIRQLVSGEELEFEAPRRTSYWYASIYIYLSSCER